MRVLVCGGRFYSDSMTLARVLNEKIPNRGCVIVGGAQGADHLAWHWARSNEVACEVYEADWKRYGRAAGPIRNQRMLDEGKPELVIAFAGGRGTADMVQRAKRAGVPVVEVNGDTAKVAGVAVSEAG